MNEPTPPRRHGQPPAQLEQDGAAPERRARRMIGGRWQDPEKAKREPRADRTISVRLTEAELAELDAQIEGSGLNRNRALRIAARRGRIGLTLNSAAAAPCVRRRTRVGGP